MSKSIDRIQFISLIEAIVQTTDLVNQQDYDLLVPALIQLMYLDDETVNILMEGHHNKEQTLQLVWDLNNKLRFVYQSLEK